jgi:hypothetical protein
MFTHCLCAVECRHGNTIADLIELTRHGENGTLLVACSQAIFSRSLYPSSALMADSMETSAVDRTASESNIIDVRARRACMHGAELMLVADMPLRSRPI